MKYLLNLLFLFLAVSCFAQEPPYTPMNSSYKFKGVRVDSFLLIPSFADTNAANTQRCATIAGSLIRTGNDFWMRNASVDGWLQNVNIGSGASPILSFVNSVFKKIGTDSVFYVVAPSDTFFSFKDDGVDTTSLSNRINNKIDSIKRISDSIYFKKNGTWFFAYKDSTGGGSSQNFANANLIATGNRYHTFNNKDLFIDSIKELKLKTYGSNRSAEIRSNQSEVLIYSTDYGDGTEADIIMNKDSFMYGGYNATYDFLGLSSTNNNSNIMLRKGSNRAFLPNYNFGIDTIALKSEVGNFATKNLSATADRNHNFKNHSLGIDSTSQWFINSLGSLRRGVLGAYLGEPYMYSVDYGDGSQSNIYSTKDSAFIGGQLYGTEYGLVVNSDNGNTYIKNGDNKAYLSRRAFGIDTIALKSDITGGGSNFANANLRATGNRSHSFANHNLDIDSIYKLEIKSLQGPSSNSLLRLDGENVNIYGYGGSNSAGIIMNPSYSAMALGLNNNWAYLPQRNFVEDTIVLRGDLTSIRKVDTIYRQAGKDSIFFKIAGTTYRIKDSTGGGGSNSPDRINGTATGAVDANLNNYDIKFSNTQSFKAETPYFNIGDNGNFIIGRNDTTITNSIFQINTGGSGSFGTIYSPNKLLLKSDTLNIKPSLIKTTNGYIYETSAKKVDCTTFSTYNIGSPGVYNLYNTTIVSTIVNMPNPADFPGSSIFIVNPDASPLPFGGSYLPIDAGGSNVSQTYKTTANYVSDGFDWIIVL